MKNIRNGICGAITIGLLLVSHGSVAASGFINTFLCRISEAYSSGDEKTLAKFDVILATKFQHDDKSGRPGDMWTAIHALNGNPGYALYTEIFLYEQAHFSDSAQDTYATEYTNNIARYNKNVGKGDRGHPDGDILNDNPQFLLEKVDGGFVMQIAKTETSYALDFGNQDFHKYCVRAFRDDFVDQPWQADGVYSDLTLACEGGSVSGTPVLYKTNAAWSAAMNSMLNDVTAGLNALGQKFACNRGLTRRAEGQAAWLALDVLPTPPDAVLEEGAFVVLWGSDAQFIDEVQWKRQVDTLSAIKNSKVLYMSHANTRSVDGSCIDNYETRITFWEALWYAMGSFLLGKNDVDQNSYFMMRYEGSYKPFDLYYDEYDLIDLGKAVAGYSVTNHGGTNIYRREFADGYVYVNPTHINVTSIPLPETCKQLTHDNLRTDPNALPDINTINLNGHRAAILYKGNVPSAPGPLSPPQDLSIIPN